MDVPDCIEALADDLARSGGVQAVVIGGSRATGRHRADSDWDVGVYYRGAIALDALATRGDVHPPGAWGRLMNGGSWLVLEGVRVDVLLRDLDAVEHWTNAAQRGDFEVLDRHGLGGGARAECLQAEDVGCG